MDPYRSLGILEARMNAAAFDEMLCGAAQAYWRARLEGFNGAAAEACVLVWLAHQPAAAESW